MGKNLSGTTSQIRDFFKAHQYDSFSTPEKLDEVFYEALVRYLSQENKNDLEILTELACEFEANPSIHLAKSKPAIDLAIKIDLYLSNQNSKKLEETVLSLKNFLNETKETR